VGTLKEQLNEDLRASLKARDEVTTATLRMALAAVRHTEVAGKAARELSDQDVIAVLAKEAKKRRESAEAYEQGGRPELAARERSEEEVLARYLPTPLTDEELSGLVARVLAEGDLKGMPALGPAMRAVQAVVAGRADGARVAAEVRRHLAA
jgi:uncharacterized protein